MGPLWPLGALLQAIVECGVGVLPGGYFRLWPYLCVPMPKCLNNRLTKHPINSHDTISPMAYITTSGTGMNRAIDINSISSRVCIATNPSITLENNVDR